MSLLLDNLSKLSSLTLVVDLFGEGITNSFFPLIYFVRRADRHLLECLQFISKHFTST